MEQYISKSALVAEIESLLDKGKHHEEYDCAYRDGNNGALYALKGKINTFEVKEVDLEKEFSQWWKDERAKDYHIDILYEKYSNVSMKLAKHFFELGLLSTITEEDCKLIWRIGDEIPQNMSEEEFFKELLKRYKAQKGK